MVEVRDLLADVRIADPNGNPTTEFVEIIQRLILTARDHETRIGLPPEVVKSAIQYDFTATQNISADTWTALDWSTPSIVRNDLNTDMPNGFVQSGRVLANDGDWYHMRVDVSFSADDATLSELRFGLNDTQGGFGVFTQKTRVASQGASVADEASFELLTYTSTSISSIGWQPVVLGDGDFTVTGSQAFFARVF